MHAAAASAIDRRRFAAGTASAIAGVLLLPQPTVAEVPSLAAYSDSRGYFEISLPANWVRAERKGDQEAKGVLFVTGNYVKAITLSVAIIKSSQLLRDAGTAPLVLPTDDLTTWAGVGTPMGIAKLLAFRRDQDAAQAAAQDSEVLPDTVVLDGNALTFMIKTRVPVQRPDLLEKERGVRELYRLTYGKALMRGDGTFLLCWAGALNTEWGEPTNARDTLAAVVASFHLGL
ncbi:hypothetical protein JKP88DRAFT_207055 [Tribonema minus]|uniref:PsbP C-terminal domain-containing protein n=1 Tax=Tribonema minus TaxID=303371 RepID=A0A835Z4Q3_9STRA|nr:hypothetical protein JKP88DRAFT_207055 [Tribonema minus]